MAEALHDDVVGRRQGRRGHFRIVRRERRIHVEVQRQRAAQSAPARQEAGDGHDTQRRHLRVLQEDPQVSGAVLLREGK